MGHILFKKIKALLDKERIEEINKKHDSRHAAQLQTLINPALKIFGFYDIFFLK